MLVTCAPDSNNLMGLTRFCHQTPLLKRRWQLQRLFEQGNKRFVLALALNRLGMHNKRTCVLYPKMHVSIGGGTGGLGGLQPPHFSLIYKKFKLNHVGWQNLVASSTHIQLTVFVTNTLAHYNIVTYNNSHMDCNSL